MQEFEGRVAVITGAASGIGRAIAERCLSLGMRLVLADIEKSALEKTAEALSAAGSNAIVTQVTNVAVEAEIEALADKAYTEFGAVHLLFNNAGVAGGGTAWESTVEDWNWVIGVNLMSVIHGVRHFVPRMLEGGEEGHIVNTASIAGLLGGVTSAPYNVTKFGVVAFSEKLYVDLGRIESKLSASVLCPGFVNTNIHTSFRNRPEDLQNPPPDSATLAEQMTRLKQFGEFLQSSMSTEQVVDQVFQAIGSKKFYILTHDDFSEILLQRTQNMINGENPTVPEILPV